MTAMKVLIHASTWFAPFLLPLLVWLLSDEEDLKRLSLQAMIFHLMVVVVLIPVSIFFSFILIGIPFLVLFGLMALIYPIMGIVRALQDRHFDYPFLKSIK